MSCTPSRRPTAPRSASSPTRAKGTRKVRNVYYMNSDGTGRTKVADNGREPCWSPDGTRIAYMKGEFEKFTYFDAATKGLFIYDLKTGKTQEHVNHKLQHLYTLNCSPDGRWFVATVHGGMGFRPHDPGHRGRRRQGRGPEALRLPAEHQPRWQEGLLGPRRLSALASPTWTCRVQPRRRPTSTTWSRARTPSRRITSPGRRT